MPEIKFLYLGLLIIALSYPLAQSFERRLHYFRNWRFLFPGILIMMAIFIPWDIVFTSKGVWWFNEKYTTGAGLFHLPLEEWLFFLVVPYACVFIYEVLKYFIKKDYMKGAANWVFGVLALVLIVLGIVHFEKVYTSITFLATSVSLFLLIINNPHWKGRFLSMYLVSWIPFILMNGVLTGNFTKEAVVSYNPEHFMGIRITTIPVEDSIYSLLMLLIVIAVYEFLKGKDKTKSSS